MLENFQGDSWGSIPPLRMPSLLPHDLCHGRSASRWLPAVIEFQLSYSRSWKMMLWKVLHSIFNMHSICNMPARGTLLYVLPANLKVKARTAACVSSVSPWCSFLVIRHSDTLRTECTHNHKPVMDHTNRQFSQLHNFPAEGSWMVLFYIYTIYIHTQ